MKIQVTLATIAGPTGGGGYVSAEALTPGDTFGFSTEDVTNNTFFIKAANSLDFFAPQTGEVSTLTPGQTVLLLKVSAQIDA